MKTQIFIKILLPLIFYSHITLSSEMATDCGFISVQLSTSEQQIEVVFSNNLANAIYIPDWVAGEVNGKITHDMFTIKNSFGFQVGYKGPYYKRKMPSFEEMVKIDPQSIFSSFVNLRNGYIKKGGKYTVMYNSNVGYYFFDDQQNKHFCFDTVTSNKVKIKIK